ncbi:hypothetical protein [Embleya sp. AB8]|uniref:hypothetical protein n=1 Tax=Embleya sp. AB8 TaxID=3156304 RepID=UPI003C79277E
MKRLSRMIGVGVLTAAALYGGVGSAMAAGSAVPDTATSQYGGPHRKCDAEYTAAYYYAIHEGWGDLLAREYADMVYDGCSVRG